MLEWATQKVPLDSPSLRDIVSCIKTGLDDNFANTSVDVVQCPDLREPPFNLAAPGLCGNPRIADVGGPANLHPFPKWDRRYSFLDLATLMEMPKDKGFLIGAGAGDWTQVGQNSELMPNLSYEGDAMKNLTHYAKVEKDGSVLCERYAPECHTGGLMANLFGSDGSPGEVLKITAAIRRGKLNFTDAIQAALKDAYGGRTISLGGVFVIKQGKANMHVMPDFSKEALETGEDVKKWLRFFDMRAPMVCLSVFHSHDPGLDLRMEHTHCFSDHNEGGHYHADTTPDEVSYEAYFNIAEVLYRIDRPQK